MPKEEISTCLLRRRLKPLMDARGISYGVLSKKSGVPVKTLYGWSAGNSPRSLADVYEVAKVLGVTMEELCFKPESPKGDFKVSMSGGKMLTDLDPMNTELRECLKGAHLKTSQSGVSVLSDFMSNKMADIQIIFERPVLVPCYLLFAIAQELGVAKEVFEIIVSYEWQFGCRKS